MNSLFAAESGNDLLTLPSWLEGFRIPDRLYSDAYNRTPAIYRSRIKSSIAFSHYVYGSGTFCQSSHRINPDLGFCAWQEEKPASWALVVFSADYFITAKLCSAAILPMLAHVPNVLGISIGECANPASILCMELCGIEDMFCLADDILCKTVDFFMSENTNGRIIFLHTGNHHALAHSIRQRHVDIFEDEKIPGIKIMHPEAFPENIMRFSLGDQVIMHEKESNVPDAIYLKSISPHLLRQFSSPLFLTPGMECFWRFGNLSPQYFFMHKLCAGFVDGSPDNTQGFCQSLF